MSDASDPQPDEGAQEPASADEQQAMDQLRDLLFGTERVEIQEIQHRLDDPEVKAVDISQSLPEAIRLCEERDGSLSQALSPVVEASLRTSIAGNLQAIADALYPVIGPAIRRSISATLQQFVDSTNRVIEQTFTVKGVKWRIESYRTGLPVGEVALRHSLVFRVEQAFLINRLDGVPLLHVARDHEAEANEDLVAGMLTAIQDFVRDSFENVEAADGLDSLQMGELTVVIEEGPKAVLAAVVRGNPPGELRSRLQEVLERVHTDLGNEFEGFAGDTAPFERARPVVADALMERRREDEGSSNAKAWVVLGALALGVLALAAWSLVTSWRHDAFVESLDQTPGVVVISAESGWSGLEVLVLADPEVLLDLEALAHEASLSPDSVRLRTKAYLATEPEIVLARARAALAPPNGLRLELEAGGRLVAAGAAPSEWAAEARLLARVIPGVRAYDDRQLTTLGSAELDDLLATLMASRVEFHPRSAQLADDQAVAALARCLHELDRLALALGRPQPVLQVVAEGETPVTPALSGARLERLVTALRRHRAPERVLRALEEGAHGPLGDSVRFSQRAPD